MTSDRTTIGCGLYDETVWHDFVAGESVDALERHLATCTLCTREAQSLATTTAELRRMSPDHTAVRSAAIAAVIADFRSTASPSRNSELSPKENTGRRLFRWQPIMGIVAVGAALLALWFGGFPAGWWPDDAPQSDRGASNAARVIRVMDETVIIGDAGEGVDLVTAAQVAQVVEDVVGIASTTLAAAPIRVAPVSVVLGVPDGAPPTVRFAPDGTTHWSAEIDTDTMITDDIAEPLPTFPAATPLRSTGGFTYVGGA